MPKVAISKKLCWVVVICVLAMGLFSGCSSKETPVESTPPEEPEYVEIPKMTDDLIAEDEESGLAVHYLPEGYAILESAGQAALLGGCSDADVSAVTDALKELGIERLTHIVVPNGDQSRWSGIAAIRETFGENLVIVSRISGSDAYEQFKASIGNMLISVGAGSSFNVGTETVQIFGPEVETTDSVWDSSLILWTSCGEDSFFFSDDASEQEIKAVFASNPDLTATYTFLNSRGESTLPYSAIKQLASNGLIVADNAVLPDFGSVTPSNLHPLDGELYSICVGPAN